MGIFIVIAVAQVPDRLFFFFDSGSTETLAIKTYEESFGFYRMGSGAALGVITLIVCAVTARFMVGRGTRLAG